MTRDPSLAAACKTCGARINAPCVYTDGPFKGTKKLSGSHGGRLVDAIDAELQETP